MNRHAKASSVGSIDGSGKGRGFFRRAFAIRGVSGGSGGSGARLGGRRSATLITAFALALCAIALTAGPASAAPPVVSMGTVSEASYASVHVTGEIDPKGQYTNWAFEYSVDKVNWNGPGIFDHSFEGGEGLQQVEDTLTGLKGETKYFLRLRAANFIDPDVFSVEPDPSFETLPVDPPKVLSINDASEVAYTTARVSGEVERPANPASPPFDPNAAFNANCNFEYVTDEQFTSSGFENAVPAGCEPENPVTSSDGEAVTKPVTANLAELAPSTTYHLRLSVSNAGGSDSKVAASTFTTLAVPAPGVSELDATNVTGSSAHFSGAINPLAPGADTAFEVSWHFECNPECPGLEGGTIAPDNSPHPVVGDTTGLQPNTTYEVSLVAANKGGNATAGPISFKTEAPAPLVQTLGVGSVTPDSADLAARINPQNSPVTYQFEWGETTSYGNKALAVAEPLNALDNTFHLVTAPLTDLSPESVYHYRVVATNSQTGEIERGTDRSFTTRSGSPLVEACPNESSRVGLSASLPDCRAYELASPGLNQAELNILSGRAYGISMAGDGNIFSFATIDAPDKASSAWAIDIGTIARRGPDGWSSVESIAPKLSEPLTQFSGATSPTKSISSDFSQSVVMSNQPLAGPGSPSDTNLYLHRANGSYVSLTKEGGPYYQLAFMSVLGASRDYTRIFFVPSVKQLDSDPASYPFNGNAYEWDNGSLHIVGIMPGPGEIPAPNGASIPGALFGEEAIPGSAISDDGRGVLFEANGIPGLYLRINGQETVKVSTSKRPGDPDPESASAKAMGVSPDGSEVLFTSNSELTGDSNTGETEGLPNNGGADLYSYNVHSKVLKDLTVDDKPFDKATGANVTAVAGFSSDFSYVYFVATGNLAPGAISGEPNLYVEHDGSITFVASNLSGNTADVTPSGLHIVFGSESNLTPYDSGGVREIYTYTYNGALDCVSCRPSGSPPTSGNVGFLANAISDDGQRANFFSEDAIVPQATNGLQNVYEYEDGQVQLLSPGDGAAAYPVGASDSGNDVFFATSEKLTPVDEGGRYAIYDAHVNADVPQPSQPPICQAENCLGSGTSSPSLPPAGTGTFSSPDSVFVPASKNIKGPKSQVRLIVPHSGHLKISGKGLKPVNTKISKAGSVTVPLALTTAANKKRLKTGLFKTRAGVLFKASTGTISRAGLLLRFEASKTKKGGE